MRDKKPTFENHEKVKSIKNGRNFVIMLFTKWRGKILL